MITIASNTLARIAKNTSALTSHVVPNRRLNIARLRVSSNRNAMPSTKKWGLNLRIEVPLRYAARPIRRPASATIVASAAR